MKRNLIASAVLALVGAPALGDPINYDLVRLGLTSSPYTQSAGYQFTAVEYANDAGNAAGYSRRYSGTTALGQDAWLFNGSTTVQAGFSGANYQQANGYQLSIVRGISDQGSIAGMSLRYSATGGTSSFGNDAWLTDDNGTIQLGFTGGDYELATASITQRQSSVLAVNGQGVVLGTSTRYFDGVASGGDAWVYANGLTTKIGLTGGVYQASNGLGNSGSSGGRLNSAGQVVGHSSRYNGTASLGEDTWLFNGTTTVRIGLVGVGYEQTSGFRASGVEELTDNGVARGYSQRYSGTSFRGTDAWIYNGSSTRRVGLIGSGYEASDGKRESYAIRVNAVGHSAGESKRYSASSSPVFSFGQDTWLDNGVSSTRIGLTGTGYQKTDTNNTRFSLIRSLNDQDRVAGVSLRYSGTSDHGTDAWLYNGSTTSRIGLIGAGYEMTNGYRVSDTAGGQEGLNSLGQVRGYSYRYSSGNADRGRDAWLYTGTTTQRIGLIGTGYEKSDGYRFSVPEGLNNLGQVVGVSKRYSGTTALGQDAWFYDSTLNQLYALQLSVRASDSYAFSTVNYLDDDGLALGYYSLFDPLTSTDLGYRIFSFTTAGGLLDLGSHSDDWDPDNWVALANSIYAHHSGYIAGHGTLAGMTGQAAYLLMPTTVQTVPIPAGAILFGSALGLMGVMRRKVRS